MGIEDLHKIINSVYGNSAVSKNADTGRIEINTSEAEENEAITEDAIGDDKSIFSLKDETDKIAKEKFDDKLGNGISNINDENELSLFVKDFESFVVSNSLNYTQEAKIRNEIDKKNAEFELDQTEKEDSIDKSLKEFDKLGKNTNAINVWDIKQVANLEKQRKYLNDFENIKNEQLNVEA